MTSICKAFRRGIATAVASCLGTAVGLSQTTLVVYNAGSNGSDFSATTTTTGLTAGDLGVGGSITDFTTRNEESDFWYEGTGWSTSGVSTNILSSFQFQLTVDSGYAFELTGMSFNYKVGGSGPENVNVLLDVNTDGSHSVFGSMQSTNADGLNDAIRASESWSHTGESIAITAGDNATIYIIGYNAHVANKLGLIDDITVFGNLTAVPEPHSFAMLAGLAALGMIATRRRRMRPC